MFWNKLLKRNNSIKIEGEVRDKEYVEGVLNNIIDVISYHSELKGLLYDNICKVVLEDESSKGWDTIGHLEKYDKPKSDVLFITLENIYLFANNYNIEVEVCIEYIFIHEIMHLKTDGKFKDYNFKDKNIQFYQEEIAVEALVLEFVDKFLNNRSKYTNLYRFLKRRIAAYKKIIKEFDR